MYDAFVSLCDYVELDTGEGCKECPHNKICFDADKGIEFAESLKRIKNDIDEGRMESKMKVLKLKMELGVNIVMMAKHYSIQTVRIML